MLYENRAKITITFDELVNILQLPKDTIIFGVEMTPDDLSQSQFKIFASHPDLPKWLEGQAVQSIALDQIQELKKMKREDLEYIGLMAIEAMQKLRKR